MAGKMRTVQMGGFYKVRAQHSQILSSELLPLKEFTESLDCSVADANLSEKNDLSISTQICLKV